MRRHDLMNCLGLIAGITVGLATPAVRAQGSAPESQATPASEQSARISPAWPTPQSSTAGGASARRGWFFSGLGRGNCFWSQAADGTNAAGTTGLPRGRRYYNNRYFNSFNNRYYGPQYGDF